MEEASSPVAVLFRDVQVKTNSLVEAGAGAGAGDVVGNRIRNIQSLIATTRPSYGDPYELKMTKVH